MHSYTIHLAINRPDCSMSARYDYVRGQDADHAVALAVEAAERESGETGWLLDGVDEEFCPGHPAGEFDPMGQTVYCDGSCLR